MNIVNYKLLENKFWNISERINEKCYLILEQLISNETNSLYLNGCFIVKFVSKNFRALQKMCLGYN